MDLAKMTPGAKFPALAWPAVGGGRVAPAETDGWRVLVVYRGAHCPLCKKDLGTLSQLAPHFEKAGIAVSVVSADTQAKAEAEASAEGWQFPVGYGLEPAQMQTLGLYVSTPRSPEETDRPFAEPGLFAVNPQGELHVIDISNSPFSRPDLATLLGGLQYTRENDYPIRGRA